MVKKTFDTTSTYIDCHYLLLCGMLPVGKYSLPLALQKTFIIITMETTGSTLTERIKRLRQLSFDAKPSLSIERALIETEFYKENKGKYPIPILRALNFLEICKRKTLYIGKDELIVGECGPCSKAVSTFTELTCHSVEDLHILNTHELQRYTISQEDIDAYKHRIIPY